MAGGSQTPNPAPWEAPGKRHTQKYGVGGPPQAQVPQYPPQNPAQYPPRPAQGARPAQPYPAAYPQAQGPAYPPPPASVYPPPPAPAYPQTGYPPTGFAQPYTNVYAGKPTSGLAIGSLVCLGAGFLVGLSWPVGIVLGFMGLRETGPTGPKSGRGMAMAGLIGNSLLTVMIIGFIALVLVGVSMAATEAGRNANVMRDGQLIESRIGMYYRDKGDLASGGHKFVLGQRSVEKTDGPLVVSHLVSGSELKNPIESYRIQVQGDTATVWYKNDDGQERVAATFDANPRRRPVQVHDYDWEE